MNKRSGKVFIDTNILFYADVYKLENIFEWIDSLYEEVFIHQMVLNEILSSSTLSRINQYIFEQKWYLFDPDDELCISEDLYKIYENNLALIKKAFRQLNKKKEIEGRRLKGTNDIGEMHCLAASLLLSARIICSNDADIQEVITDNQLQVASEDELVNIDLKQDSLVDFCYYVIKHQVASKKEVRKFLKTIQKEKLPMLEEALKILE